MSALESFIARRKGGLEGASKQVKAWIRESLALPDDAAVSVSEINCRDPACPGVETVALVMVPGETTRMVRIPRPLAEVQLLDVQTALA